MFVPFSDLRLLHQNLRSEIDAAIKRVLDSSIYILGPEVEKFEREFAALMGVKHAIGTSNGTTALIVSLLALDIKPDDEVIVPAMTFYASGEAVALLGAKPVFADIDPHTLNIDPRLLRSKITSRTKAILPVHLHGLPADLNAIGTIAAEFGLPVLGDCAHAVGATYCGKRIGSIETIAAFSFYPSKNLGSLGEAGMITTNDDSLAGLCRELRDQGSPKKNEHRRIGINARLEAIQAAVLSVKLPHLDSWNSQRRMAAVVYNNLLSRLPIETPSTAGGGEHVYHVYQVRLDRRDAVAAEMTRRGIGVNIHYPVPMHLHAGFSYLHHAPGAFPAAESCAKRTLSLPCFPGITPEQQSFVAQELASSMTHNA